jgi:hypothetical protein
MLRCIGDPPDDSSERVDTVTVVNGFRCMRGIGDYGPISRYGFLSL